MPFSMKLIAENCAAMGQNGDNRLIGCSGRIGSIWDSYRTDSNVLRACRQAIGCPINAQWVNLVNSTLSHGLMIPEVVTLNSNSE